MGSVSCLFVFGPYLILDEAPVPSCPPSSHHTRRSPTRHPVCIQMLREIRYFSRGATEPDCDPQTGFLGRIPSNWGSYLSFTLWSHSAFWSCGMFQASHIRQDCTAMGRRGIGFVCANLRLWAVSPPWGLPYPFHSFEKGL